MDLNKIMNDALVELEENGFVEEVVKKQLAETIKRVVNEVLEIGVILVKKLKNI